MLTTLYVVTLPTFFISEHRDKALFLSMDQFSNSHQYHWELHVIDNSERLVSYPHIDRPFEKQNYKPQQTIT